MPNARRHLGGLVTARAHDGWHEFAAVHGVDVTTLLELVGDWLGEQDAPAGRLPEPWRSIIPEARALGARRRSRR